VELVPWEEKWRTLSPQARHAFVTQTKSPVHQGSRSTYKVRPNRFPPEALEELRAAGFVELQADGRSGQLQNVVVPSPVWTFAHYLRSLQRFHLLDPARPSELQAYVNTAFAPAGLVSSISQVMRGAGLRGQTNPYEVLQRYVVSHRWPGWAVAGVTDALAQPIIDALRAPEAPLTLPELAERVKPDHPMELRATLDRLIARLAVFEDLRPQTGEVVFGLLPAVREGLARGAVTRNRPVLLPCAQPREVAAEGGWLVNALRALLLEVAAEPPRLKQGGQIFSKEEERLRAALGPVPACLHNHFDLSAAKQLDQAVYWTKHFGFVRSGGAHKEKRLHLSERGQKWLAAGVEEQYAALYKGVGVLPGPEGNEDYLYYGQEDWRFLGEVVRVERAAARPRLGANWWEASAERARDLRTALREALETLVAGTFYDLESVLAHLTFGAHNPLLLGRKANEVQVTVRGRDLAPLEEELEPAARLVFATFLKDRLVPFGAVQAGVDDAGRPVVARLPRLDAYFGGKVAAADMAGAASGEARVVVQPDFSVTIIGLNPAVAAELAPFCERVRGHAGEGALVLRITRDSVVKAVTHGLAASEVLARLQRHASTPVPANVLREVRDWCDWVRQVSTAHLLAIRCPDKDTADRVVSALGKRAERLTDTIVGVAEDKLTTADRNKLLKHGIITNKVR